MSTNGEVLPRFDICRPDHLLVSAWAVAVIGYALAFAVPSVGVMVLISAFVICFWFGAISAYLIPVKRRSAVQQRPPGLVMAVLFFSGVSAYYASLVLSYIAGSGIGFLALAEIRQAALGGEPVIANGNTLITAVQMNFCLALLGYIYEKKASQRPDQGTDHRVRSRHARAARWFIISAVFSLVISLLDGSRSFLLMGGICVVISQLIIGVYRVRMAALFLLAFITVFSVTFPIVRPEVESSLDGFRYTMVYFAGGIGSLEFALNGASRVYWQDYEAIMNKIGSIVPIVGGYDLTTLRMDMVDISSELRTNVYTALGVYNEYLGWFLSLIFAFCAGATISLMGRLARHNAARLFIYSFYASATVLSLFHEYYLSTSYLLLKVGVVMLLVGCCASAARFATGIFYAALGKRASF